MTNSNSLEKCNIVSLYLLISSNLKPSREFFCSPSSKIIRAFLLIQLEFNADLWPPLQVTFGKEGLKKLGRKVDQNSVVFLLHHIS